MKKIRKILDNKYGAAGVLLLLWLLIPVGAFFIAGSVFESIPGFIITYNGIFPVATALGCYFYAKKHGILILLPAVMILLSAVGFIFTDLLRYALPNVIVVTIITVFFGFGFGNIMNGGNNGSSGKDQKAKKYRSIVDD